MAPQSSSNAATIDYGIEDDKPQQTSKPKPVIVDQNYGLETAPETTAPQQAGNPHGKTEQERTGFHTAANIPPMAPQTETQFEKDRNNGHIGVIGGIKSMFPGIFEAPQQEDQGKDFATKMLNAEARHSGTDPRTLQSTRPAGPSNEWTAGETLRHGYDAGAILPGGKAPVIGPILRAGEAAAYGLGTAAGVDPQKEEEYANKADSGAIYGSSAVPIAAAVAGEAAGNAKEIKNAAGNVVDKVKGLNDPAVAPGLSDIATDNLKTGKDTRVGNERLFRGAEPSGGNPGFRESLATALPDLKAIELKNPIGKSGTKGGIINPDFRLRQTVENIDNHLTDLWKEQREPQIQKWKDSNTTARNDLGLNEDQLHAVEQRMGKKIPDHIPLGQADQLLQDVNAFLRRSEALTPEGRALAQAISPVLDSFDTMKSTLHDRISKTLEGHGEPGIKEFNRRYGALSDVRDTFRKGMNPAEAQRILDNVKVFGSPSGHTITERLHIKASPGRNVQKGLERLAQSDLPVHPDIKPQPSIIPPTEAERALAGRPTLPQVGGPEGLFGHDVPSGTEHSLWQGADPVPDRGRTAAPIGAVDMWDPERLQRWAGEQPHNVESPGYTAHLREQDAARQPGQRPPQVGDIGRVEATRPQPTPAESTTILPDRSGTATKGLLAENRQVPSTIPPAVPPEFRSEYVGPSDFNERSRLGARGDQGVRGPILIHDPQPGPTTQPRTPAERPALAGPVSSGDVPRGTNGPKVPEGTSAKAGTANDRPQVKYKPSEKAETMSGERKNLGKQFDEGELTHEVERNQGILDNPKATEEEKDSANKFFEQHPDRKLNKTDTRTADERNAARAPKSAGKVGQIGKVTPGDVIRNRAGINRRSMLSEFPLTDRYRVDRLGDQLFAVEPGPNGVENRVSFKEGESKEAIHKRLDDQAEMRRKFFSDREEEKRAQNKKDVDTF